LEQPTKAYSPSAAAASWRPPHSFQLDAPLGLYDRAPLDEEDIPTWFYGDAQMGDAIEPGWLDSYLQTLYFQRLSVSPSHTPTDMQRNYILTLPGLFSTYCHRFQISPDHHLNQYNVAPFWDFVDKYKCIEATGRDC